MPTIRSSMAIVFCCGALTAVCARIGRVMPPQESAAVTSSGTLVSLDRSLCYGDCPSYEVTVDGSGHVVYQGRAHVTVEGAREKEIGRDRVEAILARVSQCGFFEMKDRYSGRDSCPGYCTDFPTVTISVTHGGKSKRIAHYLGCAGLPELVGLTEFETKVDEMIGTAEWVGRPRGPNGTTCFRRRPVPDTSDE